MPTVISLMGRSYCGSTVVNLILSAHPKIFGGGELHRTGLANRSPVCPICGEACAIWTPEFLASQHAAFDYGALARQAGCNVLIDASKTTAWYEKIAGARQGHTLIDLCLTKHPMRHISSFIDNQYYRDNKIYARINMADGDLSKVDLDLDDLQAYAVKMALSLTETYRRALSPFAPKPTAPKTLRYEDVVRDRRRALAPILAEAGLEYHPAMDAYEQAAHHGLGGNAGAYSVIRRAADSVDEAARWRQNVSAAKLSVFRHGYYGGAGDVAVDDKYLRVMPEPLRAGLMRTAAYQELCGLLGYAPDPEAQPDERRTRRTAPGRSAFTFSATGDIQGDVRLRRFPAPYRAMLAISSDIDRTSVHGLRAMHRFINTEADTANGPGVGLDFANSMWMYGSTGGRAQYAKILARDVSYWRSPRDCATPSPVGDELIAYAKTGWIDTLHTYGNFSQVSDLAPFTRDLAETALEELENRGVRLTVWTNHGSKSNRQNIGVNKYMQGDAPGSPAYHADLLTAYGVRFLHSYYEPSRFGHEDILSPMTLRDGRRLHMWPRFSTIVGDPAAAARASSMNGLGRVSPDDNYANIWFAGTLGEQLNRRVLDAIVADGLFAILGQHLGTLTPMAGLDASAAKALRLLRAYQDDGRILVARTSRLLRYAASRKAVRWSVIGRDEGPVIDIARLEDPVEGRRAPTLEDVRGLTFEAPAHQRLRIAIAGELVDEAEIHRTAHGRRVTAGVKWHARDTTDWSEEFRRADRHASVSGYPLSNEDGMQLSQLNQRAVDWLDTVAAPQYADADPQARYAHKYARGRYDIGLEHYGGVMERLGFTGRGLGLDVGSGAGHWVCAYAALNEGAVGLDVRSDYVRLANGVADAVGLGGKARSLVGDGRVLPFEDGAFDTVWSHGVLMVVEHDRMLAEMNRVLANTGAMYLAYNSLGHRLQALARVDEAAAQARSSALLTVFNTGLYKFGVYRTARGRVRAYTREDLQQTARYCGFETLGAPSVQDVDRRWGDVETTIDLIARKRLSQPLLLADIVRRAVDDDAVLDEAQKAMDFGAPDAARRLIEIAKLEDASPRSRRLYLATGVKSGAIDTPNHPAFAALQGDASPEAARVLGTAAFNFARWEEALDWFEQADRDRATGYLAVAAHINAGAISQALSAADGLVAEHGDDLFLNIALLKALEAAGEQDRLIVETARFVDEIARGSIEVAAF